MKLTSLLACAGACAFAFAPAAHAQRVQEQTITNAKPASAVAPANAVRTLEFTGHRPVQITLTLRGDKPVSNGWNPEFRFGGQTETHNCVVTLPKSGQLVKPGETAVASMQCNSPWKMYDNGLNFEAFDGGRKVADGTVRP